MLRLFRTHLANARLDVIAGEFDSAASEIVCEVANAEPTVDVWAWWKRAFGKRKNYSELSLRLVNALLKNFHTRSEFSRQAVAKIFNSPKAAAALGVDEFIQMLRRKRKREYPLPDHFVAVSELALVTGFSKSHRYHQFPFRQNGAVRVDLRKDSREIRKMLETMVAFFAAKAAKNPNFPKISGVTAGFYFCQAGWLVVRFDTRPVHARDGDWTTFSNREVVKIPQWKRAHDAAQAQGGAFVLPSGKNVVVRAGVSCKRLAAIYGRMIKDVLLEAQRSALFAKLPLAEAFTFDVEEFDGMWAWPANTK